jgi:hypothetical protein
MPSPFYGNRNLRAAPAPKSSPPPVSKTGDSFISTDMDEIRLMKAVSDHNKRAFKTKKPKRPKSQGFSSSTSGFNNVPQPQGPMLPAPPILHSIINPTAGLLAAIQGQIPAAQGRVSAAQKGADASLKGLAGTTQVPGASTGDVAQEVLGSLGNSGGDLPPSA